MNIQSASTIGSSKLRTFFDALAKRLFMTNRAEEDWAERMFKGRPGAFENWFDTAIENIGVGIGLESAIRGSTRDGVTLLHYLSCYEYLDEEDKRKHKQVAELLIQHGADVNARTRDGVTPLRSALERGFMDYAHVLMDAGADLEALRDAGNATDKHGWTLLHKAACWGVMSGTTPDQLQAIISDRLKLSRLLIQHGADVNATNKRGWTPIFYALGTQQLDYAQFLVDSGADIEARDGGGRTPMDTAREGFFGGSEAVIEFINRNRAAQRAAHLDERLPAATAEGQGPGRF